MGKFNEELKATVLRTKENFLYQKNRHSLNVYRCGATH